MTEPQPDAATETAAAETPTKSAPKLKVGALVTDEAGRTGIVTGLGRTPGKDEGPEPLILWLEGTPAPYGGDLTPVS